jgi:hypothetical protein
MGGSSQGGTTDEVGGGGVVEMAGSAGASALAGDGGGSPSSVVLLQGAVVRYDTRAVAANVAVQVIRPARIAETTTDQNGSFLLELAPQDVPDGDLELWLTDANRSLAAPRLFRTVARIASPATAAVRLPNVDYDWLVRTATACGGLASDATPDQASAYFSSRSTLIVEAVGGGSFTRADVQVVVTRVGANESWTNTDPPQGDDGGTESPTRLCFLEADESGTPVGSASDVATALSSFVMFRVRNATGTAVGTAEVQIAGLGSSSISVDSAGQIGVVRLGADW